MVFILEFILLKDSPPIILVGNKIDLVDSRKISKEDGEFLANKFKAIRYIDTSAKTGLNIDEIFASIVRVLRERNNKYKSKSNEQINEDIKKSTSLLDWCNLI